MSSLMLASRVPNSFIPGQHRIDHSSRSIILAPRTVVEGKDLSNELLALLSLSLFPCNTYQHLVWPWRAPGWSPPPADRIGSAGAVERWNSIRSSSPLRNVMLLSSCCIYNKSSLVSLDTSLVPSNTEPNITKCDDNNNSVLLVVVGVREFFQRA